MNPERTQSSVQRKRAGAAGAGAAAGAMKNMCVLQKRPVAGRSQVPSLATLIRLRIENGRFWDKGF